MKSCNHQDFIVVFNSEVCPVCNIEGEPIMTQNAGRFYLANRIDDIARETHIKIPVDVIDYDIGDNWDSVNKRYIVPSDGVYLIHIAAGLSGLAPGNALSRIYIYVNGEVSGCLPSHIQYGSTHVWGKILLGSCPVRLKANDYIEMYIWHNGGDSVDIIEGNLLTFMSIVELLGE